MRKKPQTTRNTSAPRGRKAGVARILVVDDHPLMRQAISETVQAQHDMSCVGEAGSVEEALAVAKEVKPAAAIVDLTLGQEDGIALIRTLKNLLPKLQVLVLSMHDELVYAEATLRAGARGYLMKGALPERMIEGVRTVLEGNWFVSPQVESQMLERVVGGSVDRSGSTGVEQLSERELQVFEDLGRGMTALEIAAKRGLNPKTVQSRCATIRRKLNLGNAHALIHCAVRWVEKDSIALNNHS